jgi:GntR family transcriptional regulator, transcriptional repressor for pyruvate dehydrogenase complex
VYFGAAPFVSTTYFIPFAVTKAIENRNGAKGSRHVGIVPKSVTPIPRTTLTATAFEQLISHVVKGTWKPGDRIPPERDLCQQLGIARTSLREALKAMELVGMVDSRVGDGTFVCPRSEFLSRPLLWAFTGVDHEELHDVMEARTIIEVNLAGLAAERASDNEIANIRQAVQMMRDSIARGDSILEADMAFHLAIAAAARNEALRNAVQLLRNLTRQWIHFKLLMPGVPANVLKRHEAIYRAIVQRKPTAARSAMRTHLEEAMALVTKVVQQYETSGRAAVTSKR